MKRSIEVKVAEQTASDYYLSFLALISSGRVELPDDPRMVSQFLQLERRVRPGGKDSVTHPAGLGFHDDVANAVAGAVCEAGRGEGKGAAIRIGGYIEAVNFGDPFGDEDRPLTAREWASVRSIGGGRR